MPRVLSRGVAQRQSCIDDARLAMRAKAAASPMAAMHGCQSWCQADVYVLNPAANLN